MYSKIGGLGIGNLHRKFGVFIFKIGIFFYCLTFGDFSLHFGAYIDSSKSTDNYINNIKKVRFCLIVFLKEFLKIDFSDVSKLKKESDSFIIPFI